MPITIDGTGSITGLSAGGLPDLSVATADLADGAVTQAKRSEDLTLDTAKASTSGTVVDFTGIPSWAKRITVMLNGVSTSGTSSLLFQLGTSGGVQTTGYTTANTRIGASAVIAASSTAGWAVNSATAASTSSGHAVFTFVGTGVWVGSCMIGSSEPAVSWITGRKDLSGTLDRVRVTTVNGTDTFDAGSINIMYE
jgi:hypothetical protein